MKKIYKIPLIIAAVILVLIIAILLIAPGIMFNYFFSAPERSTKIPDYYIDTPHYRVSQAGLKIMKKMKYEDASIESFDGLRLHAYMFPAEKHPKKFVIGVHGYRSYSRPEYAPYIEFYQSLGYSMLLPDDRAHRPSEGEYIGFGVLDRLDVVDWARYLVDTYGEDIEIILHGVSMGGATVCAASGEENLPSQVKGIISDCAFSNAWDVIHYQFEQIPGMPVNYLLSRMEKLAEKKAGFNFHDYSAIEQVKNAKVPMLFVQGKEDPLVPAYMAEDLYNACGSEKKELLIVPEAGHGESIAFAPDEYHELIKKIIQYN